MQKSYRPLPESIVIARAVAVIGALGACAAGGAWNDAAQAPRKTLAEAMPAPGARQGGAPKSDTRADMPHVCARPLGCLPR